MSSEHAKPEFDTVTVRFGGEIGIKAAWTRRLYERRLAGNIRAALKQQAIPYKVLNREFGRLYIRTSHAQETSRAISNLFGVSSVSSAIETTSQLKDITETSVLAAGYMSKGRQTFAVRCRRVGSHAYSSQDVCRHVGKAVLDAYSNRQIHVDLSHPDLTLEVEVRENKAYVSVESLKGPGGLPVGVQPKVVGMLDDNINSIVACWMVMKRGCPIIPVHFTDATRKLNETKTIEAAKALFNWSPGFPRRIYILSNKANIGAIKTVSSGALTSILLKRLTFRVTEELAEKWRAEGIVTGDVLQKPAKESVHFFHLCDEALSHLPIHRPLVGLYDSEIEELAKRIGFSGKFSLNGKSRKASVPSTGRLSLEMVRQAETKLSFNDLVESSLESLRTVLL